MDWRFNQKFDGDTAAGNSAKHTRKMCCLIKIMLVFSQVIFFPMSTTPVVVGTRTETLEVYGVPVPVDPLATLQPAPPPHVVEQLVLQQSHYQLAVQAAARLPALPPPGVPPVAGAPAITEIAAEFMELNSWNAAQFAKTYGDILKRCTPSQWHQIIVKTPVPQNERKAVISAINKLISPQELVPYFFRMENMVLVHGYKPLLRMSFFVHTCGSALKALCERDLVVPYLTDRFHEIDLTIILFNKDFNLLKALEEIVLRRLDSEKKFLDLSYINNIPEVQEMLYDPTDNWHILDKLVRIAHCTAPELTTLRLAGNGIEKLTVLVHLMSKSNWKSLRTLDLSDNEIKRIPSVPLFNSLQISEVYLDRNPICQILGKDSYVRVVKATFPHLAKLDGTYLHTITQLPYWKPNFIINSTGDAGELADQFIEHFFTLYDDSDRMKLRGLYHETAYFSLNCSYLAGQSTTSDARLSAYSSETRNLLYCSNTEKLNAALTHGSERILERLSCLPDTRHDPYTFTVDLMVHTLKLTVLTVTGVFRDVAKEKSSHRHFSRTFVLMAQGNGEYQITNDLLYISNAATQEAEGAFQFARPPKQIKKDQPPRNLLECEKELMIRTFQQLTNMSAYWSRKRLEDTDWNLKKALLIFVDLQIKVNAHQLQTAGRKFT